MVYMLALSVVDHVNDPQSGQNKLIFAASLLSMHHLGVSAYWLAKTQSNASE